MSSPRIGRDDGFSLVELVTVIAILGILVATAMASYVLTSDRSRAIACRQNQRSLDSAIGQYQTEHDGRFPAGVADVATYVRWSGTGFATCVTDPHPAFEYDSTTGEVSCPIHPR